LSKKRLEGRISLMFKGWFGEQKTEFNLWFSLDKKLNLSPRCPYEIEEPEISKEIYSTLTFDPHYYRIQSDYYFI